MIALVLLFIILIVTLINSEADNTNSKVYSISGQMEGYGTQNLKPGLYIKDGKKIIVR